MTTYITMEEENIDYSSDSRRVIYKNLLVVSFSIFFLYTAFFPLQDLQTSLYSKDDLGGMCMCTIFTGVGIGGLFLSAMLLTLFGPKRTMIISICGFSLFIIANFHGTWLTLIPLAFILGLVDGPLWCAAASYIKELSKVYAVINNVSVDDIFSKFYAIFFGIFKLSQITGNIVSSNVLRISQPKINWTIENSSCGASFCPSMKLPRKNLDINPFNLITLVLISLVFGCISLLLVVFLLDQVNKKQKQTDLTKTELLVSTIKEMRNPRVILLIPIIVFSGLQCGLVYGDFTEAYVTCYIGVDMIGWTMGVFGLCSFLSSIIYSQVGKYVGSFNILVCITVVHTLLFIWLLKWVVLTDTLYPYLICAGIYGICDTAWRSQMTVVIGNLFSTSSTQMFSLLEFWKAAGFVISFAYGRYLCVDMKIYSTLALMFVGVGLYGIVHIKSKKGWERIED